MNNQNNIEKALENNNIIKTIKLDFLYIKVLSEILFKSIILIEEKFKELHVEKI